MNPAVAARVRAERRADEATAYAVEAWATHPQHKAWLDELWASIDARDPARITAAQHALAQPTRYMGWPAQDDQPAEPPPPPVTRPLGAYARRARKSAPNANVTPVSSPD